jgi:endothelin-converting enzyme/putative endopeptidase
VLCAVLGIVRANAQSAPPAQSTTASDSAPKLEHFDPNMIDKSLDPCQDFYQYACSKWNAANPIPPDQVAWGTGSGLNYWNENVLREAMQKAAAKTGNRTDYEQKVGDYWAACMDESGIETAGIRDLKVDLERIDQMKNKSQLAEQVAHLHMSIPGASNVQDDNQAPSALLGFGEIQDYDDASKVVAGIDQGGMGLPGRDFYIKEDAKSKEIRAQYEQHIRKMLELSGESAQQTAADAKAIIVMETAMAQAAMDNVTRRDPKNVNNKMTLQQVTALTPSFDWKHYLGVVGAPPSSPHYLVSAPPFFRALEQVIQQHSVADWKVYLRWHLVHGSAPFLSKAFVDENWDFYAHTLFGAKQQQPRWRRCVRAADRDLGEALGEAYVAAAFPPESKQRTISLVHDIEHALDQDITSLDWMQAATKEQAKTKLHAIEDKVGYPNHWRDYSSVKVTRGSYLDNVHQATAFEFRRELEKIGRTFVTG